jgi:hypothetical protein
MRCVQTFVDQCGRGTWLRRIDVQSYIDIPKYQQGYPSLLRTSNSMENAE